MAERDILHIGILRIEHRIPHIRRLVYELQESITFIRDLGFELDLVIWSKKHNLTPIVAFLSVGWQFDTSRVSQAEPCLTYRLHACSQRAK